MFIKIGAVLFYYYMIIFVSGSIFHENTKVIFKPGFVADLFGYSVALNSDGLIVGAPKSKSNHFSSVTSGAIFNCSLGYLGPKTTFCPQFIPVSRNIIRDGPYSLYKNDMWFGGSVDTSPTGQLIVCAPRYVEPFRDKHLLAHGMCLYHEQYRDTTMIPLNEKTRQAFMSDGRRPEYGDYGEHLSFYAYGQAGVSVKFAANSSLLIGAPGLLQWTGGVIKYEFSKGSIIRIKVISNPYYTKELGPDNYFGYSVDSGVFQPLGDVLTVGGAPRSLEGYGQVLIINQRYGTREQTPQRVLARIKGSQLGAYFGAAVCCVDIDGDGLSDLVVGAPNHAEGEGLPYDQGAVFVYMTRQTKAPFEMISSSRLSGSGASGARFGTAISGIGDIDGDGFNDVAVGAPWENDGSGVVYIYRGDKNGVKTRHVQRLTVEGSKTFGISISKGFDVDSNNCNDVAIGAARSTSVYLFRCVPTIKVRTSIQVPDAMNLPHNATGFSALFCITADSQPLWPHVKLAFKTRIMIDPEENRATISGDASSRIVISPGNQACSEQDVDVKRAADLSKPISLKYVVEPDELLKNDSKVFNHEAARVSEDSVLHSTFLIQLTRDCGEDKICTPWLDMTLVPLANPYIPGETETLGATLTIANKEEPAYGAKVNITLPSTPIRVPSECTLEALNMTCDVPAPLLRNEEISWDIELDFKHSEETTLKIEAELFDPLYYRNITDESVKEVTITVTPVASFDVSGEPLPNDTVTVSREDLTAAENISFIHRYEITNLGPSEWTLLQAEIILSETIKLLNPVDGCHLNGTILSCYLFRIFAKDTRLLSLPLQLDLSKHGELLVEKNVINVTTHLQLNFVDGNTTALVKTSLVLEPAPPLWPVVLGVVAGSLAGLFLLSAIVYMVHKHTQFFKRTKREELKRLIEQSETEMEPGGSAGCSDDSTHELIVDDSE